MVGAESLCWRKISIRSLGEAASLAAFKNSEIDVISASSHNVYADVSKMSNIDIRKGTALGVSDYELNPDKIPLPRPQSNCGGY